MQIDEPPYPGLRSFKPEESEIFFGRDECIDAMLSRLAATRFLSVLGSSGVGKSSLVKTGLLSALQMGLMQGASSSWLVIDFRPGQPEGSPMRNLVRRLLEKSQKPAGRDDITSLHAQFMQEGPRALLNWCRQGHLPAGTNLLLLVDQFEELFRYQDYSSREEAEAFVALLLESKQPLETKSPQLAELPIYVTLTMRSEFLGACSLIQNLPEAITEGAYLTPRMTRDQYREAIVGPAEVCGIKIEDTLVNRVLNDLAAFAPWDEKAAEQQRPSDQGSGTEAQDQLVQLARRADQLPVLQHALNRIWRSAYERREAERKTHGDAAVAPIELTLNDYNAIGGLENALNAHANTILENVSKDLGRDVERTAERLFRALVTGSTPSDAVRRPTPLGELTDISGDETEAHKIVEAFRANECNFLTPEAAIPLAPGTVIDINHESLIRQWKKLSEWVVAEAAAVRQWRRLNDRFNLGDPLRGRVLDDLVAWRDETDPNAAWAKRYGGDYHSVIAFLANSERAEKNRRWIRNSAVASLFTVLFIVAGTMFYLWQSARMQRAHAEENYAIAKEALRSLTFNFAGSLDSGDGQSQEMQITQVTDAFQKTKASLDDLAKANANDLEFLGIQADILDKFIDGYRVAGYSQLALNVANEANGVLRRLVAREPKNPLWQTSLSLNLGKIGDLKGRLGDAKGQLASFEEALSIDRALMALEPAHEDHPRQAAIELISIGDLQQRDNEKDKALASYQEAFKYRKSLAALYPILPIYQRDASSTMDRIGDLRSNMGNRKEALDAYQEELNIDRQIIELKFGVTATDHTNISLDLRKIAGLQEQLGDDPAALKSYQESVEVDRPYADRQNENGTLQQRFASTLDAIGNLLLKSADVAAAKKSFASAVAAEKLAAEDARVAYVKDNNSTTQSAVVTQYGHVAWYSLLAGDATQAANYAAPAFNLDKTQIWIEVNLAHADLFLGRYDDAKAIYLKVKDTPLSSGSKRTYADEIRDDFGIFHKLGIATPDLDRMAHDIGI